MPGRGRVDRGLGSVDVVSLAQARAWALDNKLAVKRGEDPFAGPQRSAAPTLRKIASKVAESNRARLSASEQKGRGATLERYAAELLDLPVDRVCKPEVLRALERVWTSQPGTGRKLRTALGALFRHARAAGLVEVDPVAAVAGALVPQPAVRAHMRSVPYADAPAAMQRIATCRATLSAKACLRFQILTAARPSEARLARWGEIDEDVREWRIPACRMKRNREHVVPLVPAAFALLGSVRSLRRDEGNDALVFPSPQAGAGSLSAATVAGVLRSAGLAGAGSPHGWRSTFRTWASERAGRGLRGDGNESVACGRLGCRAELFAVDVSGQAPGTARHLVGVPCRRRCGHRRKLPQLASGRTVVSASRMFRSECCNL